MIIQIVFAVFIYFSGLVCSSHTQPQQRLNGTFKKQLEFERCDAAMRYLQGELSKDSLQPRAQEYRHLLKKYQSMMLPLVQRQFGHEVAVNLQELNTHPVLSSKSSHALQEQYFGLYADSIDDKKLDDELLGQRVAEGVLMHNLRLHWRRHALFGGAISSEIVSLQSRIKVIQQERHKIGAIQLYRQNKALAQEYDFLTPEMRSVLKSQIDAYELAKYLQFNLSVLPDDPDFNSLRIYIREQIEEKNCLSHKAGALFIKMYNAQITQ